MIKDLFKDYIYPIAVFAGGMIGVGFLSLPYIAMQSGIWVTIIYLVLVTALIVVVNIIFCEISLKTPDFKRFPGFVGHYLGRWPEFFTVILSIVDTPAVLLVYLIVGGGFLATAFQPVFYGSSLAYVFIFFLAVSIIIYFDINIISKIEFWVLALLFLLLIFIFAKGFHHMSLQNLLINSNFNGAKLFLPYGPLLFALWGTGLIPEAEEMLIGDPFSTGKKKNLKKIITISTIIIAIFYLFFIFLVLSISGSQTDQTALGGLEKILGDGFVSVSLFVGALAAFTAFIMQGIIFKKTLVFDLKIKHWQAFVMTCFTPMILFLLGLKSLIFILSFTGAFFLGITGILILLMYKKIGGKNIVIYPLSLVFLLGAIYEIIYFVR